MRLKLSMWCKVPRRKREKAFDNDYEKSGVEWESLQETCLQSKESKLKQAKKNLWKVSQKDIEGFASQSIKSRVTLREGITAKGSLEFHGCRCGHLIFLPEVSEMI